MKILLISTCKEKLSEYEFVKPIVEIIKSFDYDIINYRNLETLDLQTYDKVIICNGGDRTKGTTPEMEKYADNPRVEFKFGVGGEDKKNSSSWILNRWNEEVNIH